MLQKPKKIQILKKYSDLRKYLFLVVTIAMMIVAIRVYINYVTIGESIENTRLQTLRTQDEVDFITFFYKPYQQSDYAKLFFAHENTVLQEDEFIVKFFDQKTVMSGEQDTNTSKEIKTPQETWLYFLQQKWEKVR
ncbi:MAG TPA: hypothetical protein PKD96_01950 [Candidatus Absconditabacterales bacterium]|nr:hypothetical protein [Candidatus Absconditabacterales bacterium]HMT27042.1 hypothetical protein [Candidatus Absconditabacterales bacterium]